ncbi:hypothetical protein BCPG3_025 [Bacillus phage BCPG3]|uniref:Uncharacterized protein n=3 Tax=Wphvirus TaxID=1922327 RepID=W5QUG8_9CAUD|nr:hypothetical protein [Bacillus thuringiensis]YP_006907560.1 hypothetical protein BPS13_0001 [Bacillus phage BPS13]YP_009002887.1 hypothetical protein BPS10C_001 [Bacillus phage BPS10C]YP_009282030.1 hypothetical protein SALINJAH_76 [Bacillus phage SalinJah]QQO38738.1 hypothetical protein BCPG1_006 [Bacillus phage BCPG1]QSJ04342.1 hypothetical protein BCPG3_025 [Bacillus phage BCPG3]AEZ50180.1 hypothetical protein BPS13_0001 [Bacillus phage BPS13]AGI11998.1 hypothetical protein BPS10C_001 
MWGKHTREKFIIMLVSQVIGYEIVYLFAQHHSNVHVTTALSVGSGVAMACLSLSLYDLAIKLENRRIRNRLESIAHQHKNLGRN